MHDESTRREKASIGRPILNHGDNERRSGTSNEDPKSGFSADLHAIDPRSGSVVDRRSGLDRRELDGATNLERRRGPGRRLTDFVKAAEEGEMNQEQFLFLMAIEAFKKANGKTFPTWTDVLEIIRKMGYRKTMPTELTLGPRAQDWTEKPDAPSGVWKEARDDEAMPQRKAG